MQESTPNPIYVTVPSLSPIEEYVNILKSAWDSRILTHNGPLVQKLEKEVDAYLQVKNTVAVTNGTIALQLAIRALDIKGEIITTPFSWVATVSSIMWEGCTPVFADINPDTFNIDPNQIEACITPSTKAIMPVHVFSNPADIDAINKIAEKYNLKVIYDAAHAFGVNYNGKSVMTYGDISCTSFHATKIFNSGEGGACFAEDYDLFKRLQRLRFFGHDDAKEIVDEGINGKLTEVHAALGLANMPYIETVIKYRKAIFDIYYKNLSTLSGLKFQKIDPNSYNYSYLPIVFSNEELLLKIVSKLNERKVFPRRYFYPSLNTISLFTIKKPMPVSEDIASRILCLPSHNDLQLATVEEICHIICQNYN